MEYVIVNEWYGYWYATMILMLMTALNILVYCGLFFVMTVVYDIYKQVTAKWTKN
jgi:hypothetical protein